MKLICFLLLELMLLPLPVTNSAPEQESQPIKNNDPSDGDPDSPYSLPDLGKTTPRKLIQELRSETSALLKWSTVARSEVNWVRDEDLLWLIGQLESNEPCASIALVESSCIATELSTVGNEAAFLLIGYFVGTYPPDLNSLKPGTDNRKRAEELIVAALRNARNSNPESE